MDLETPFTADIVTLLQLADTLQVISYLIIFLIYLIVVFVDFFLTRLSQGENNRCRLQIIVFLNSILILACFKLLAHLGLLLLFGDASTLPLPLFVKRQFCRLKDTEAERHLFSLVLLSLDVFEEFVHLLLGHRLLVCRYYTLGGSILIQHLLHLEDLTSLLVLEWPLHTPKLLGLVLVKIKLGPVSSSTHFDYLRSIRADILYRWGSFVKDPTIILVLCFW